MILDFGKHKGTDIEDIPLTYMIFLSGFKLEGPKRIRSDMHGCVWVQRNKPDVYEFAKTYLSNRCWHCGSALVPVGGARANGADHEDWDSRHLHKKCWRELKAEQEFP